jgi:hypothetical protein
VAAVVDSTTWKERVEVPFGASLVERLCNKALELAEKNGVETAIGTQPEPVLAAQKMVQTKEKDWELVGMGNAAAGIEIEIKNDRAEIGAKRAVVQKAL